MAKPNLKSLLEQAAAAYQHEDYMLAQQLAESATRVDDKSVDAWDFHGMTSQELGDRITAAQSYKKALKLAQQAYKQNPNDGKMALRQLFLLMRLDRKSDIEDLLVLLKKRHPDSPGLKKLIASYRLRQP